MRRMKNIMNYTSGTGELENWLVEESAFDPAHLGKCEAIFSQGNGYLGIRSALEERYIGEKRTLFVTGTFNCFGETEVTELPNFPDVTCIPLEINGRPFRMDLGTLHSYRRTLNLKTGEVTRFIDWEGPTGERLELTFRRIVSKADEHVLGAKITVRPLSGPVRIRLESGIDGQMTNTGSQHFHEGDRRIFDSKFLQMVSKTTQSAVTAAVQSTHRIFLDGREWTAPALPIISRRILGVRLDLDVPQGSELVLEKLSCVYTSSHQGYDSLEASIAALSAAEDGLAKIRFVYHEGYDRLFAASADAWKKYWLEQDVRIDSCDGFDQLAVRFALYHLAVMCKTDDNRVGIGAKGLSGEGYKGHSFWDTEIFILPFFLYTQPDAAKTLMEYRHRGLAGAYRKAKENGFRGAMYPWEAAWFDDGEVTPLLGEADIVTGKPIPILTGQIEQHVTADIVYAVWQYVLITGDREFLRRCGTEIIVQTARFWVSRLEWNNRLDRFEINDVIGPDEYKEHVNNNAYTNYMARFNMDLALELINDWKTQDPAFYREMDQRLRLDEAAAEITAVHKKLYLPQPGPNGIIPQFDGYLDLKEINLEKYKKSETVGGIYQDYNAEQINELMVSKQADLMVLFYLHDRLFDGDIMLKNYRFYEARTLHDSSLSKSTHCVLAASLGLLEEAYSFFRRACEIDLGPSMKTSNHGIHSAAMGGIWQCVVLGFGGLKIRDGELSLSPHLPQGWSGFEFPLVWHGTPLRVTVTAEGTTVRNNGGASVQFLLYDSIVTIPTGESIHRSCKKEDCP